MVSVQFKTGANFTHECGGSIIDKSWVVTAGHCNILGYKAKDIRIAAGSSFRSQMTTIVPLKNFYRPKDYDGIYNDIMLLQLQKPLKFGSTINKINLETDIGKNYTGDLCTITGWGRNGEGNLPDRLQILSMPAVNKTYCGTANFMPEIYWNKILCLQEIGKDSCNGDSGGPVICNNDNKLAGLLSFGLKCNGPTPSVHTKIAAYLDWIKDTMNTKNKKNKKDKKNKNNTKSKGKKSNKNNRNRN
ncbi:trypsin-like [Mytilus edulis]|uniref:trypsin-like n=1 Tax=Mytilus edulis TaxID=6550 RepID=UPI0039F011F2